MGAAGRWRRTELQEVVKTHYRPDVDGLRAVAVLAVLAYHGFPESFSGGFVGVDIFFVISGYLISRLIWSDLSSSKFTFARFYGRRVRRIFPALAVVLAACAVAGWLFLLADEWREFGRQLFAGVAFVSNIALATEHADYFAIATHSKPLLHLWSLGVEEQFYFVWPALLFVLRRRRPRTVLAVLASVAIGSFALNVATVSRHAAMTFYLPVTRVWELALGSLIGVTDADSRLQSERLANVVSFAGIALCIGSMFVVTAEHFPGFAALGPTVGTFFLAISERSWINRNVLASRSAVAIGLISYPLYLWHWPLLCFTRIVSNEWARWMTLVFLALSVILAALTYRLVEKPIRSSHVRSRGLGLVVAVLGVILVMGAFAARGGFPPRLRGPEVAEVVAATHDWSYPFGANFGRGGSYETFTVRGGGGPVVLFIGDSHIEQYWARIEYLVRRHSTPDLRFATNGGCPPLRGVVAREQLARCDSFLDFAVAEASKPEVGTVIFGAAWPVYLGIETERATTPQALREFAATVAGLVHRGKRVYVLLSSPMSESFSPRTMISRLDGEVSYPPPLPARLFASRYRIANGALRAAAERAGATVIDPLSWLCPGGSCPAVTSQKTLIYKDAGHLRPFYVRDHALFLDSILSSRLSIGHRSRTTERRDRRTVRAAAT